MTAVIIFFLIVRYQDRFFVVSVVVWVQTMKARTMLPQADHLNCSDATCEPIHLLYFVTPALGSIQVIGRNTS